MQRYEVTIKAKYSNDEWKYNTIANNEDEAKYKATKVYDMGMNRIADIKEN
jgi:hypothetical protein